MGSKTSHLEMIQAIINRMSVNSFLLKGWSVVLISALFALAAAESNIAFIMLAYFPAIAFWCLDGYFLHQERLYRDLYDHVRSYKDEEIDYAMDTRSVANKGNSWAVSTISKTLLLFHGAVIGSIIVVMLIVLFYPVAKGA